MTNWKNTTMNSNASEELDVRETISHARSVLHKHRDWLRKHNPSISPLSDSEDELSPLKKGVWENINPVTMTPHKPVGSTSMTSLTTDSGGDNTSLHRTIRPHSGKVVPLSSTPKNIWHDDDKTTRKKGLSRGSVVPLEDHKLTRQHKSTPDVFFSSSPSSTKLAWDNDTPPVEQNTLTSQSEIIKSEIRLRETLSQIKEEADTILNEEEDPLNSSDDRVSLSEATEYKQLLKQLQSSSTGTIIPVQPAPKHQRTSYLKHNNSKVGIENVSMITTSSEIINDDIITSINESHDSTHKQVINSPSVIYVLPKRSLKTSESIVYPVMKTRQKPVKQVSNNTTLIKDVKTDDDIQLDDTEEWIPPDTFVSPISHDLHDNKVSGDIVITDTTPNNMYSSDFQTAKTNSLIRTENDLVINEVEDEPSVAMMKQVIGSHDQLSKDSSLIRPGRITLNVTSIDYDKERTREERNEEEVEEDEEKEEEMEEKVEEVVEEGEEEGEQEVEEVEEDVEEVEEEVEEQERKQDQDRNSEKDIVDASLDENNTLKSLPLLRVKSTTTLYLPGIYCYYYYCYYCCCYYYSFPFRV